MLRPLATTLVSHTFRAYVGVAFAVTLVQTWFVYHDQQSAARSELQSLARALEPSVTQALWNFQEPILQTLADGMLLNEVVASVRIGDTANTVRVEASRNKESTASAALSVHRQLFVRALDGSPEPLGYLDLSVNRAFVISRIYQSIVSILLGALIKAAGLWFIIVWLAKRLLTRPLRDFTRNLQAADLAGVTQASTPPDADCIEFAELHEAFAGLMMRAAERRTLQNEKLAAEAHSAEQSRFLANASHDLRQPLHALTLYLGALDRREVPPRAASLIDKAQQCAQVVEGMFRSILDLSQLDAGGVRPEMRTFPVQQILDGVRIQFEPLARNKNIALHIVDTSLVTRSDQALLSRVIHNLVSNAVRYTRRGRVLVGCRRHGATLRIEIHDTGPGIADSWRRTIFAEYKQGEPRASGGEGVGLGLAIAQRLSKSLGHPLALRSTVGRGSIFSLQLPRIFSDIRVASTSDSATASLHDAHADPITGKIVMIVDDDPEILDATSVLIEKWGGIPVTAASHDEAMAVVETPEFVPDALLCDLQLPPDDDGNILIQHIREATGHAIPALLVTGARLPEGTGALAAHVLYKPVSEETLYKALTALLSRPAIPPLPQTLPSTDRGITG